MTTKKKLRLRWMDPAELGDHPENWKTHPGEQIAGLESAIEEVGWAGALLFNQRTNRLLDGHARKKLDTSLLVEGKVPVLVGSWDENEERVILATLDPLGSMAKANEEALSDLLARLETESEGLQALLDGLSDKGGESEPDLTSPKFSYESKYGVIITCTDETHQQEVYETLSGQGYDCKVVVV